MSCSTFHNLNALEHIEVHAWCIAKIYSIIAHIFLYDYIYDIYTMYKYTYKQTHSYTHAMQIFVINEMYLLHFQ